ncbi:hypothetical protein NIES4071_84290 [Calothrix sp. NIES-4071]|nr:hypothetical protein NIES4071_84290 [Calothrix sp. NIES-4071]BAZ62697.1 hypothetical protein NIES4105_84220 [Calothrix sp. NIES-4105]
MIKDDEQLAYTKELASKFEEANRKLKANEEKRRLDPDGWQLIQDSNQAENQLKILVYDIKTKEIVLWTN